MCICICIPSLFHNLDSGNYSSVVSPSCAQPTVHQSCKLTFKLVKQTNQQTNKQQTNNNKQTNNKQQQTNKQTTNKSTNKQTNNKQTSKWEVIFSWRIFLPKDPLRWLKYQNRHLYFKNFNNNSLTGQLGQESSHPLWNRLLLDFAWFPWFCLILLDFAWFCLMVHIWPADSSLTARLSARSLFKY